jgi:hypothetical protein
MSRFVSVRIRVDQYEKFQQVAQAIHGSVNGLVQYAADNYLNDEAPIIIQAVEDARKSLKKKK